MIRAAGLDAAGETVIRGGEGEASRRTWVGGEVGRRTEQVVQLAGPHRRRGLHLVLLLLAAAGSLWVLVSVLGARGRGDLAWERSGTPPALDWRTVYWCLPRARAACPSLFRGRWGRG